MKAGIAFGLDTQTHESLLSYYDNWVWGVDNGLFVTVSFERGQWRVHKADCSTDVWKNAVVTLVKGTLIPQNGYPLSFDVLVKRGTTQETFTLRDTDRFDGPSLADGGRKFHLIGGYIPTLLIGMVGPVGCGKTCYAHSVRYKSSVDRFNRLFHETINCIGTNAVCLRPDHSPLTTFNGTPFQVITKNGREVADVILVDMAGELTKDTFNQGVFGDNADYNAGTRIDVDNLIRNCKNMDALILFTLGSSLFVQHEDEIGSYRTFLKKLNRPMLHAVAITGADMVYERLAEAERTEQSSDPSERKEALACGALLDGAVLRTISPVFNQVHTPDELYTHIALAHDLYSDTISDVNAPVFLLSSLKEQDDGKLDFSASCNVELPMAWLMSRLLPMHFKGVTV